MLGTRDLYLEQLCTSVTVVVDGMHIMDPVLKMWLKGRCHQTQTTHAAEECTVVIRWEGWPACRQLLLHLPLWMALMLLPQKENGEKNFQAFH